MSHTSQSPIHEELYHALFEQAADGIFIADPQLCLIEVNVRGCELVGYSRQEILRLSLLDLIPAENLEREPPHLDDVRAGRTRFRQHRVRCKDGRLVPVESSARMLSNGSILGIVRDLTERNQAERALRESEQKYRLIAEKASDVVWLLDLTGKSLFVSPSVEHFTGYTVDEYLKQTIQDRFTPESTLRAMELFERYVQRFREHHEDLDGNRAAVELEYICKTGGTKWGELVVTPYFDEKGGFIAIHGVTRDITERKRIEEALRKSEEKYRLLSENATDVIWQLDLATQKFTYVSPSVQAQKGYTPEEAMALPLDKTVLPESYQKAIAQITENLVAEAQYGIKPDLVKLIEFQEYCKDGSTIYSEAKVKFTRDKDGKATGIIGITRNITKRKQIEAERERLIVDLETALDQVKRLSGLLPICASCKKIRDDTGYWQDVAVYIRDHSEAKFSHGLCPDCAEKLYPEYFTRGPKQEP